MNDTFNYILGDREIVNEKVVISRDKYNNIKGKIKPCIF